MASKLCLRCDWSGETRAPTCPRCGAQLFDRPSAEREPRPERSWRGWIAPAVVVAVAAVAFVTIQRFTPSPPAPTTGLDGFLVYAGGDGDQERLWIWNLATDTIQPGPVLTATPSSIVSLYAVENSWVGLTMPGAAHGAEAQVLRSADPSAQPVTIAHGGSVAWQDGGLFLSSTRSEVAHGCFRRVVVGTLSVSDRIGRHTSPFLLCGKVVGLFRDSLSPYLETVRSGAFELWRVFKDGPSPLVRGYEPLGASQNGDFLVRSSSGRAGMYYPSTSTENRPVMIKLRGNALVVSRLLTWSVDGNVAYVFGSIGGVEGVFAVTVGPRREPGAPTLVVRTSAIDVAASVTVTNDVYVMADGTLRFVHEGAVTSVLTPPAGVPPPTGPLLWVLSLPYSPSVTP